MSYEDLAGYMKSSRDENEISDELQNVQTPTKQPEEATKDAANAEFVFDPFHFLQKLLHPKRLNANQRLKDLKIEEVEGVCNAAIDVFTKEENLLRVYAPVTVVGDVHGNFHDLYRALLARTNQNMIDELKSSMKLHSFSRDRFLFLGDYINNGSRSVECVCLVLALKVNFPERFFLLRGSQEGLIGKQFSKTLIEFSPLLAENLIPLFERVFSWMPLAAVVGEKIFCVHGGISPNMNSLEDIKNIQRPLMDIEKSELATDLIFSDPLDYEFIHIPKTEPTFEGNYLRNRGVLFNEAAVKEFLKTTGMKLIIRSSTMTQFGYRFFADKKLITIFNSSGYKKERNCGALLKIDKDGKITIITLQPAPPKKKKEKNSKDKKVPMDGQTISGQTISTAASERAAINTEAL